MATLSMVLEKLRVKNKANEFLYSDKGLSINNAKFYQPEDLKIIKTYRFEGDSNPDDNSVLYIIEATDGTLGYSIDAYGVYSNYEGTGHDDFIRKIAVEDREDQQIFGE